MRSILLCFVALFIASCTSKHCRTERDVIPPKGPVETKKAKALTGDKPISKDRVDTVRVYKYDGTKQCSKGKEITLNVMAEELKDLDVFVKEKLSDGLMRIQVCGQPTGMANVYEIRKSDLEKAESRGFKVWDFK